MMRWTLLTLWAAAAPLHAAPGTPFGAVRFEENRGQTDGRVRYVARAAGYVAFLDPAGILLSPAGGPPVRVAFAGASSARWSAAKEPAGRISYFTGNDRAKWVKNAPVFDRVQWKAVYPGIDLVLYASGERLEYDLVLAPGADPGRVRLRVSGAVGLRDGAIELGGLLVQRTPAIFQQDAAGRRQAVAGRFVPAGKNEFRLDLGGYDASRPLVVDPVIEMLTYLGGENDDEVVAVGETYVAGNTQSVLFPGALVARRRSRDVFVRFIDAGQGVPASTLIFGGAGDDELATALVRTGANPSELLVFGTTNSRDLPGVSPFGPFYGGGASDGFILHYRSTRAPSAMYAGGSGEDRIHAAAVDAGFRSYGFTGTTDSPDLPVNVPGSRFSGGTDAFFATGSAGSLFLDTLGYFGGRDDDRGLAIAITFAASEILLGGETRSDELPGATASPAGGADAFLARLRVFRGREPEVSTFRFGGSGDDRVEALAAAVTGESTVTPIGGLAAFSGTTSSPDLPLRNPAQPAYGGGESDAFAGLWNTFAANLEWLTYLGGSGADAAGAVSLNWAGDTHAGGWTRSTDLPVRAAVQPNPAGGEDGLFAEFDRGGRARQVSYLGGSGDDRIRALRVIQNRAVRVGGSTTSEDLPQASPWQAVRGARSEGFVAQLGGDYLTGPSALILPKDGLAGFNLRSSRSAFSIPVTYRSSDPSRVRLVLHGRSAAELTANLENTIYLEALEDNGEVEIVATAEGHEPKRIGVRLYPGAFVSRGIATRLTTFSTSQSLQASYQHVDPETGRPVPSGFGIRAGAPPFVPRWTTSDPSVVEVGTFSATSSQPVLIPRGPGQARLQLEVPGYPVWEEAPVIVSVERPRLTAGSTELALGKDLQTSVSLGATYSIGPINIPNSFRGTFTVTSEDPSRVRVGDGRATITFGATPGSSSPPAVILQALRDEGTARVRITASELEGEAEILVRLEPARLTVSLQDQSGPPLQAGDQMRGSASWSPPAGGIAGRRTGAPPVVLRLTNSNPEVMEWNRLTMEARTADVTGTAIAAGRSRVGFELLDGEVRLSAGPYDLEVLPSQTPSPERPSLQAPTSVLVGKDLQATVSIRGNFLTELVAVSRDPGAVLVSSTGNAPGAAEVRLERGPSEYALTIQALRGEGEAVVTLRSPGVADHEIRVTLVPSGVVWTGGFGSPASPFEGRALVVTAPLEETTTFALRPAQPVRAGLRVEASVRPEGEGVRVSRDSVVLSSQIVDGSVDYTLPPAGQEGALVVTAPAGFTDTPDARLLLRRTPQFSPFDMRIPGQLARDTMAPAQVRLNAPAEVTFSSSDPERMRVSLTAASDPAASVGTAANGLVSVQLHGLTETGFAILRIAASTGEVLERRIALAPLVLSPPNSPVQVAPGATVRATYALYPPDVRPRPGTPPPRLTIRSSNPSAATVTPESLSFGPGDPPAEVEIRGVAAGDARLEVESAGQAYAGLFPVFVTVRDAIASLGQNFVVGKNFQGAAQLTAGNADFRNPGGAIVTVVSDDPGRVRLSRSATGSGTASVTVAVPPGQNRTTPVYIQGIETGQVTLRISGDGVPETRAVVHVVPAWLSARPPSSLNVGAETRFGVGAEQAAVSFAVSQMEDRRLLPGLGPLPFRVSSSDPEVVAVVANDWAFPDRNEVRLRALRAGEARISIEQPPGFGPAPGDDTTVGVVPPAIEVNCRWAVLGKDTQQTCRVTTAAGVSVAAESEDPARLLVSADPSQVGTARATVGPAGLVVQALAGRGTAEVVLRAPGYREARVPMVLRPAELAVVDFQGEPVSSLNLTAGQSWNLPLSIRTPGGAATVRAGAEVAVEVSAEPTGVVDVVRPVVIPAGQSRVLLPLRGLKPGSTLLRISSPAGLAVTGSPIAVTVR